MEILDSGLRDTTWGLGCREMPLPRGAFYILKVPPGCLMLVILIFPPMVPDAAFAVAAILCKPTVSYKGEGWTFWGLMVWILSPPAQLLSALQFLSVAWTCRL